MEPLEAKPELIRFLDRYLHEPVNCLSHLLGVFLSVIGMLALLSLAEGEPWRVASFAVYGLSSILLYLASTLFHGLKVSPERRRLLLRLDHVGILALIAGSYTPIALIPIKEHSATIGWALFSAIWGLATLGMVFKLKWLDAPPWLSTGFYLLMGWFALFAIWPIMQSLPAGALLWLLLGGIFYTVGAVIFVLQRPNLYPGIFEHHELWHVFVLCGGLCHFLMLLLYVAPQ